MREEVEAGGCLYAVPKKKLAKGRPYAQDYGAVYVTDAI